MRHPFGLAIAAALYALAASGALASPTAAPKPKLVVAIAIDQFSASLFEEWRGRFTGGLARLASGVVYPSGYQSHAATETCPGHSTILTGAHPSKTGIVGNTVRDPQTGRSVYCLYDPSVVLAHDPKANPVGPGPLMAGTLGDWLKAASPLSRVVAVAGKDRGAITLAGHQADGVFWLPENGTGFTTYLRPGQDAARQLAPVAAVNARIARMMTTTPDWRLRHADCRAAVSQTTINGVVRRAQLPPEDWTPTQDQARIRRYVKASPAYDDATLLAARAVIRHFDLGRGPQTDLLAVSFSSTDFIGHQYGSRGPEMCEQIHNLDRLVGELMADLDRLDVPYVVALTADHGGSDTVERLASDGYLAYRADGRSMSNRVNQAVMAQLGLTARPLSGPMDGMVVSRDIDASRKPAVIAAGVAALKAQPEVADAFSQAELLETRVPADKPVDELSLRERFSLSVYPGRSPDILAALQPYTTTYRAEPGGYIAGHGSPWNYDRRVPILFWWPGAPHQERALPIRTVDIAPSLANAIGLTPPADLDGRCLPLTATCERP